MLAEAVLIRRLPEAGESDLKMGLNVAVDRRLGSILWAKPRMALECPYNVAGSFPRMNDERERERERKFPCLIQSTHTV